MICVLCGNKMTRSDHTVFVDNGDAAKGAAHLECGNAQKPARETPGEFLAHLVAAWIGDATDPEENARDLAGPAPSMLDSLADALEAYGHGDVAEGLRKQAAEERGDEADA